MDRFDRDLGSRINRIWGVKKKEELRVIFILGLRVEMGKVEKKQVQYRRIYVFYCFGYVEFVGF